MNISTLEDLSPLSIQIIFGLDNAEELIRCLKTLLEAGNVLLVDLTLVTGKFHLLLAISRALRAQSTFSMKTKDLSAEILYQLSPSGNINETAKQFNVSSSSTDIAVIVLNTTAHKDIEAALSRIKMARIENIGDGFERTLSESSISRVVKAFKMSSAELVASSLEDAVITKIAIKDL